MPRTSTKPTLPPRFITSAMSGKPRRPMQTACGPASTARWRPLMQRCRRPSAGGTNAAAFSATTSSIPTPPARSHRRRHTRQAWSLPAVCWVKGTRLWSPHILTASTCTVISCSIPSLWWMAANTAATSKAILERCAAHPTRSAASAAYPSSSRSTRAGITPNGTQRSTVARPCAVRSAPMWTPRFCGRAAFPTSSPVSAHKAMRSGPRANTLLSGQATAAAMCA